MNEAVNMSDGDSLIVDFGEVEDQSFEVLPRGTYNCIIADCEFSYSAAKGTPMWTLRLEVSEGDYANRVLFTHMVMAGAGLPITKKNLGRIRPDLLELPFDPQDEEVIASMIGVEISAKVKIRKFEGEDRNNVGDLYPAEAGGFA